VPNWVGDAVLCTPALTALKDRNPSAIISVLAVKRVCEVFLHNPCVDEIVTLPGRKNLSYWLKAMELRREKYDLGILFPNSFSSAFFFRLSGVPRISGYCRDGRGFLLTDAVEVTEELLESHQVDYYLDLIGNDIGQRELAWTVTEEEKSEAKALLRENGVSTDDVLVGIGAGAAFGPAKRWPPEYFAGLADELIKKHSVRILLFGAGEEKRIAFQICDSMQERSLNLVGRTNLRQLGALLSMCRLLVSNDSGVMHVGAAVKTPLVAIFGSTDPSRTGPRGSGCRVIYRGLDCSPCFARRCSRGDYKCLREIKVEDVLLAAEEELKDV
jgi:heptosyltransferase-2